MNLGRSIATIGGWTMLSRITGLAREMLVARYLGAGLVSDAFFVAFRFPNLFRSLFAEGAFNPAFVPLFAGKLETGGEEAARLFAEQCYAVLTWILIAFVAIMEIIMPWAMYVLAPGFGDLPGKMALATELSRITFPYLLFISLVSIQSGVLNGMGRFAAAAGTPVLLNLVSIAVLVALVPFTPTAGHAMAWGVFASGIAQFAWLVFSVRRVGMALRFRWPRLTPEVKLMLKRTVPGAIGAGVYQINLAVNTIIASTLVNGAVSYLNYAERVDQLPLGVVGVAVGTALLPMMSRQLKSATPEAAAATQNRAVEFALLLTLPATLALVCAAHPIVKVLFERGHFTASDSVNVAHALSLLASGLPAYVLAKGLTPAFFAREDTRTPVRWAMGSMGANVALNLIFMWKLSFLGMALATSLSAWFNVAALWIILRRRGWFATDARLAERLPRICVSALIMAAFLLGVQPFAAPLLDGPILRFIALAVLIAAGAAVYALAVLLTGAARLGDLKRIRP
jgi:putative peptidoglycan lipid II flippase